MKSVFCAGAGIQSILFFLNGGYLPAGRELSPRTRIGPFHRPPYCPAGNRVPPQRTVLGETPAHAPERASDIHLRRLLGRYGLCTVERLCALCAALRPQAAPACALAAQRARQLEADGVCCRVRQLAVNGRDLMAAGIPAGPALRRVLEALLDGVIRAEYPNEKPALLAAAQEIIAS